MKGLRLDVLDGEWVIHRLDPESDIPAAVFGSEFSFVAHTDDEVSVVCRSDVPLTGGRAEPGWSCLRVAGPLDLNLTGVLSGISGALAHADVGIFAVSTFDTDYIFVRQSDLARAVTTLREAGYGIAGPGEEEHR